MSMLNGPVYAPYGSLLSAIVEILDSEGKAVVFVRSGLEATDLAGELNQLGINTVTMTANEGPASRAEKVSLWQAGMGQVFITTYMVGGVGVRLNVRGVQTKILLASMPPSGAQALQAMARVRDGS